MDKKQTKQTGVLSRLMALAVTAALVLGAVALVARRDELNMDGLRRWFTYRTLARGDGGQAESFPYEGAVDDLFVDLAGDLLVCAPSGVRLYSSGGTAFLEETLPLTRPALSTDGETAAIYDVGGRELRVIRDRTVVHAITLPEDKTFLSASVDGAYLTVTTAETGYKGVATVYDSAFLPLMTLRLSSRFLMDALVAGDGATLVALSLGLEDNAFTSTLDCYDLSAGDTPAATCSLGNHVVLEARSAGSQYWAVTENALMVVSTTDGSTLGIYDYGGRYLKNYTLSGDGFGALLLGKYRAGSAATLVTVDETGAVLGELALDSQVLAVSAAGRYVAVLTATQVELYTKSLLPYAVVDSVEGTRNIVLRGDGSLFLIQGETARLWLPD